MMVVMLLAHMYKLACHSRRLLPAAQRHAHAKGAYCGWAFAVSRSWDGAESVRFGVDESGLLVMMQYVVHMQSDADVAIYLWTPRSIDWEHADFSMILEGK